MHAAPETHSSWWTHPFFRWSIGIVLAVALGALIFEALDISVFKRIGMAHEYCYQREPKLIWLHVVSDVLIGVAYVSISATLAYIVYRASRGIPFNWVFLAFGLFIISCGLTHFMEVWVIWEPVYWLSGYVKVVTAAASVATAAALFPLVPKIFRLVAQARESERRRIEIEQLNLELERFNYSVAHDLRSPLRGITGFGELLQQEFGAELPPRARHYVERMQQSATRMDALISGLLAYATIGRKPLALAHVPLEHPLREAVALLETEIRTRGAEIVIAPDLPAVAGDAMLLQVAFQNLLGNALKFVAPGVQPRVEVTSTTEHGRATVRVTDNGVGIPPELRARVFGMFERGHPNQPGTGIGLAIVQRAVERLGGQVGVTDAPGGRGTQFWLRLPLSEWRGGDQARAARSFASETADVP